MTLLQRIAEQGIETVHIFNKTMYNGRPALILRRYGQGSKDIVKLVNGKVKVIGSSKLLNAKSVSDLRKIRETMVSKKIKIDDLQFLIGSDGSIVVADPLNVFLGVPPSSTNLKIIDLLIYEASN